MAVRLGIELSPTACRIIEIDGAPRWARATGDTRVRSFTVLPPSGPETAAKLASFKGQRAAVIVWRAANEHRQVVVTGGSYESMRREALAALAAAGLQTRGVLADIAPAAGRPKRGQRQPVVVTLASAAEMSAALEPLHNAGIQLRSVMTPAVALGSLARLRRKLSVPGAIEAYVALEHDVICIALVRDGVLVAARDLRWGYAEARGSAIVTRPRAEIASRLDADVAAFVTAIGGEPHDVGQVCVMGGLPELRSMTAEMTEHLDVEVEPLDSMFAIDAAHLPEPVDEFRDRAAELRLAWAAAADWPPAINLLRARHRQTSRTALSRAAVAAGIAAGLLVGWRVQQSPWWQAPSRTAAVNTAARARSTASMPRGAPANTAATRPPVLPAKPATIAAKSPPSPSQTAAKPTASPSPATAAAASRPPATPPLRSEPVVARAEPPRTRTEPAPTTRRASLPAAPTSASAVASPSVPSTSPPQPRSEPSPPQTAAVAPRPVVPAPVVVPRSIAPAPPTAAAPARSTPASSASQQSSSLSRPAVAPAQPQAPPRATASRRVSAPPSSAPVSRIAAEPIRISAESASALRARPAPPPEVALPFEATLGTILYSSDRKLAIVDGRIIGVGDEVRGARVVDITQTAVMLRDGQGRLRRLTLGAGAR